MTVATFAPTQSRQLLGESGDPVYELCKSQQEAQFSHTASTTSFASSASAVWSQIRQSQHHSDGNIIVSADYTGQIKVFRQDCAWAYHKTDSSDTASIRQRSKSSLTWGSSSIRQAGTFTPLKNSSTSRAGSIQSSRRSSVDAPPFPSNSSQAALATPKNLEILRTDSRSNVRTGGSSESLSRGPDLLSPRGRSLAGQQDHTRLTTPSPDRVTRESLTTPGRRVLQENGQSLASYNPKIQRSGSTSNDRSASVSPHRHRRGSISSDHSGDDTDGDGSNMFVDAAERLSSSDDMVCRNCGARTFNAFKAQSGPHRGQMKLRCSMYVRQILTR